MSYYHVKEFLMSLNFVDLFAGCGGLSEGFYRQGFNALAHLEINHVACETLKTRMNHYGYPNPEKSVLEYDITKEDVISKLENIIQGQSVDVIIGGPPCQSFSSLGRAKDENGMKNDPRNYLFESYVKVLNHFSPKVFVFENVTGLLTATLNGDHIINKILSCLSENYKVDFNPNTDVLNAVNYGVPQIRKRVIIIGVRKDIPINPRDIYNDIKKTHYDPEMNDEERKGLNKFVTVKDAIGELPALQEGEGEKFISFSSKRNNDFLKEIVNADQKLLMDHVSRHHNPTDVLRYQEMAKNHWTFEELLENRKDLRHEKKRVFGNSYVVQWWDSPARTIIAHLYKDGNQFIHPDASQGRTLTVREAARLQSFPDDFVFEGPRTEQFKQIGNAVPPLFAEAIAKSIKKNLEEE